MSVTVKGMTFRIGDSITWQLLGMEGECLSMRGELTAIRVTDEPIGVAKDDNGQMWLLDLAEVKNESPFRSLSDPVAPANDMPSGVFDPIHYTKPAREQWGKSSD